MVLVVVAHVPGELVERTVVGVSLLALSVHVVLGDEVSGQRVAAVAKHQRSDYVNEARGTNELVQNEVRGEHDGVVDQLEIRERLGLHNTRAAAISQGHAEEVDQLEELRPEERAFPGGRDVSILSFDALELVVLHVVALEGDGGGNAHTAVTEHREVFVRGFLLEDEVVGQLVSHQRQRVAHGTTIDIRHQEEHRQRHILGEVSENPLRQNHRDHDRDRSAIRTEKGLNLRMRLQNRLSS
mmetsp:Transcript_64026/g.113080  ORF Transcript_64026/g.113080 Transcript_64026/m.113080 type:complete len:241 (+) Transcript_64026:599-1321(+)